MQRLTKWDDKALHYTAQDSAAAMERLAQYETLHETLLQKQQEYAQQLEVLRAQGKKNTVQFREVLGNKLLNTSLLALLQAHGLE